MEDNQKYITGNTSLAAYLKAAGFKLLIIQYHRKQGTFVFELAPTLEECVNAFNRCEASGNIVKYQMARDELIDRIKRGLP